MKNVYLIVLLGFSNIFAADFGLEKMAIRNANFQFESGQGQLSGDTFEVGLKGMNLKMANGLVNLDLSEDGFDISYQEIMGSFKTEDQSLFNNLGTVDMSGLNIDLVTGEKIHFNINRLAMEVGDGMQGLDDVRLLCQKGNQKSNIELILPCLENGALSIKKISVAKESKRSVRKALTNKALSIGSLDNFYIRISNNKFTAQLYTTIIFKLKVSMEGSIKFNEVKNEFALNLTKAKAGWFNVKSKVIDAIKDAGFKGVRVEGNMIYFTL